MEVETESGELIPISVLIVPSIAAPIQNLVSTSVYTMPHLRDLKFAHPITSDKNFTISLLIGTDHYWSFVEDHIIRGKGPTATQLLTVLTITRRIVRQHIICPSTDNV